MGLYSSRVTDVGAGICCCHPPAPCVGSVGVLVTGAPSVVDDHFYSSRITDVIVHACGHVSVMVTGNPANVDACFYSSRVTDLYVGCVLGVILTGSPVVLK